MIRQKLVLGDYIFLADLYKANEDLVNPTYKQFYILRNSDIISGTMCDNHIYFIDKELYESNNVIYPINKNTAVGYSINVNYFNSNFNNDNIDNNLQHLYNSYLDDENVYFDEANILCDMIRIYFPTIKNRINAIIDIENFINDIKFHYLIADINYYDRKSVKEITADHQTYSEYIDIYIPSLKYLLYDPTLYINSYDTCISNNVVLNIDVNDSSVVPFNILYYPFEILTDYDDETRKPIYAKNYIFNDRFINNQFYSTLNLIIYPYSEIDNLGIYVNDNNLDMNAKSFNIKNELNFKTEIKFPELSDFNDDEELYKKYYGVPCAISTFTINNISENIEEQYLSLNGVSPQKYSDYDPNDESMIDYKDPDDEFFGEELWDIKKTGFYIEMATDKLFKDVFFKYKVNIYKDEDENPTIIDNFTFPLKGIFSSLDDIPNIIVYRIIFVDKVSCDKIYSNPVIITNEWYKYLINYDYTNKLNLKTVYKYVNNNMIVGNYKDETNPILFIDKINCSIIKDTENGDGIEIVKRNSPKIIYKPVFYKTSELQNIEIRSGITQNIGVNLDEYLSKVETFKLIIEQNEYIEYGRNSAFVIFKIDAVKLNTISGKYIITDENNEYISDGNYTIS